jgi:hypothetical protein
MRVAITILVACCGCASALAGEPARTVDRNTNPQTSAEVELVFDAIDSNHDQRISRSEARRAAVTRGRFDGMDADEDGFVSRAEYRARPRAEDFE